MIAVVFLATLALAFLGAGLFVVLIMLATMVHYFADFCLSLPPHTEEKRLLKIHSDAAWAKVCSGFKAQRRR